MLLTHDSAEKDSGSYGKLATSVISCEIGIHILLFFQNLANLVLVMPSAYLRWVKLQT